MIQLGQQGASAGARNRHSFGGKGINDETLGAAAKQFGIGKFRHGNQYHQMTSFIQLILCINIRWVNIPPSSPRLPPIGNEPIDLFDMLQLLFALLLCLSFLLNLSESDVLSSVFFSLSRLYPMCSIQNFTIFK